MRSGFDLSARIIRVQVGANVYGSATIDGSSVVGENVPCSLWQRTTTKMWGIDLSQEFDYTATLLLPVGVTVEIGDTVEVYGPTGMIASFRVLRTDFVDFLTKQQMVVVSGEVINK